MGTSVQSSCSSHCLQCTMSFIAALSSHHSPADVAGPLIAASARELFCLKRSPPHAKERCPSATVYWSVLSCP